MPVRQNERQPEFVCADAIPRLKEQKHGDVGAIITSLPDAAELGLEPLDRRYIEWFY